MLEEARQADVTKAVCADMGWNMFVEVARAGPEWHIGEGGAPGSAPSGQPLTDVTSENPSEPMFEFGGYPSTIEDNILKLRGSMTAAQLHADKIVELYMVVMFSSGLCGH